MSYGSNLNLGIIKNANMEIKMNTNKFTKPRKFTDEQFLKLRGALTMLTAKQQLVIYLRFWENRSVMEISNRIGLSWHSTDIYIEGAISHLRHRMLEPSLSQDSFSFDMAA